MPKIDIRQAPTRTRSGYPEPFDEPCKRRHRVSLSEAGGLTQFGAHIITLPPGEWSSQRHWHSHEDELVYILSGHPTLIDNDGETVLAPGDVTTHPAGAANGHHMINRTGQDVRFLIIGTHNPMADSCHYPDIDLVLPANGTPNRIFTRKDGRAY